jgi:hypothetical protein
MQMKISFNLLLIIKDYYIQFIIMCSVHFIHFATVNI